MDCRVRGRGRMQGRGHLVFLQGRCDLAEIRGPEMISSTSCPCSPTRLPPPHSCVGSSACCSVCSSKARLRDSKGHRGDQAVMGPGGVGLPPGPDTSP